MQNESAPQTLPGKDAAAGVFSHQRLLALQQSIGNRAVSQLLRRSALEDNTNEAERGKIQIATRDIVAPLSDDELKAEFNGREQSAVSGVEKVEFGREIDPKVRPGLENLAGKFVHSDNSLTNAALDLRPFGGANGVYRFALVKRSRKPQTLLLIDQVSATPPANGQNMDVAEAQKRFAQFGFKIGSGFDADENKRLLLTALARVPDAVLARVQGATFELHKETAGDSGEAGHYDPNTHTVRVFAGALAQAANSADAGASNQFTYVIAHEIGHAVDSEHSASRLQLKRDTLKKQLAAAVTESKKVKIDPNAPIGDTKPSAEEERRRHEVERLKGDLDQAERDLNQAMQPGNKKPSETQQFKSAVGTAVSEYGATSGDDSYAEAFSMYVLDPSLLRSLRPKAFAYFERSR